jgi:hypothetical protein
MTAPTAPPPAEGPRTEHGNAPFDVANNMLSIVPVSLTVSPQETPQGQRLCCTVRTVDTTLTVFLAKDEVQQWLDVLAHGKGQLNGLILPG